MSSAVDDSRRTARRALRATAAAVLVVAGAAGLIWQGRTLLVVLAGVLFALALRAPSRWIADKTRAPYLAVLAVVVLLVVGLLGLGTYFLGAGIAGQLEALGQKLPQAWAATLETLRHQPALARITGPLGDVHPALPSDTSKLLAGAGGALELLGAFVVVFFLGVYGAAQPDAYSRVVLALVPPAHKHRASLVLGEMGKELTRWLAGRVVAMLVVGILVTVGLYILRVPLAGTLGALAGVLTFVEYLGAFASAAPALLLGLSRGVGTAAGVAVLFTIAHVLEGYVLTPFLVRTTVRIPPGYTLAAQILLGSIFGIAGLTFATPITILGTVLVQRLYIERQQRRA
ncbi:MAG TPA: AI-2E family transporter [Polyangiaceae bacterium]